MAHRAGHRHIRRGGNRLIAEHDQARPIIGIDCRMIDHSGIGVTLWATLRALVRRSTGWKFRLLCPADTSKLRLLASPNVEIIPFEVPIYSIAEQWQWWTRWSASSFDLLWVPHYNAPIGWRGKTVVTVHDVAHVALPSIFSWLKRAYANTLLTNVARRAAAVAFDSRFTANEFERFFGPPAGDSAIIPNAVSDEWLNASRRPKRSGELPHIVAVGNLKPHKNLSRLIEAFGRLSPRIPHKLMLIGTKEGFLTGDPSIARAMARFQDRIECTGWIPDADLIRLVAQADLLVQPSFYEGFGLPPLEAMAVGCPVAVSRCASLPEVCGDAAVYFDPFDIDGIAAAMEPALFDMQLRERLIEEGRLRVQQFSWDKTALQLEDLMRTVLHLPCAPEMTVSA